MPPAAPVDKSKPVPIKVAESRVEVPVVASTPPAQPKSATTGDLVKEKVLALVAEKTGYPVDMLDLDLDLEADLGVDTVKQAEVFASIREAYNIPRDDNRKLRDYPTLAHVIRFVYDKRPDLAVAPAAKKEEVKPTTSAVAAEKPVPAAASAQVAGGEDVKDRVLALVVEKTGYPKDMLDLDLDLEADLGVDTVKQAEMFAAIREIYSIPRDENRKLRDYPTLAHVIRFVFEKRPDLAKPAKTAAEVPAIATARQEVHPIAEPTPVPVSAKGSDSVKERVLALVVEKTGYPKDMLDLDLDLEADLGVDTVKQAEMFAAIREIYNIPRDENRKLRDYPTLAHVIRFVFENRPDLSGAPAIASTPVADPARAFASACRSSNVQGTMRSKRRCWRSWRRSQVTRKTCWIWISTSKQTSASTPSNKQRCSRPCERRTTFRATRISSCATSPPWLT